MGFTPTEGSAPLKVIGDDGDFYYTKTTEPLSPPYPELVNEVICNYYCTLWGLISPQPCIIKISSDLVSDYITENGLTLLPRYRKVDFSNRLFYGSKVITNPLEIDLYINGLKTKREYNRFFNPMDLIKIGVFDLWIGNKDRKPENPNVLISEVNKKLQFTPIDHTAAFGYVANLKELKEIHLHLDVKNSLLSTQLSLSILKFAPQVKVRATIDEVSNGISESINSSLEIFAQVPSEWGFSKKAKGNLLEILSNTERNKMIAHSFINLIPKK